MIKLQPLLTEGKYSKTPTKELLDLLAVKMKETDSKTGNTAYLANIVVQAVQRELETRKDIPPAKKPGSAMRLGPGKIVKAPRWAGDDDWFNIINDEGKVVKSNKEEQLIPWMSAHTFFSNQQLHTLFSKAIKEKEARFQYDVNRF